MSENGILQQYPELYKYFYPISISRASLIQKIDCSKDTIPFCKGYCCNVKMGGGRYFEEEYKRLPNKIKKHLEKVEPSKKDVAYNKSMEYRVKKEGKACPLIDICLKHPEWKPIQCRLFPLRVSKTQRLYIQRWAWWYCPNRKKGEGIWISMEQDLRYVFGDKFYEKLKAFMATDLPDDAFKIFTVENIDNWLTKEVENIKKNETVIKDK